MNYYLAFGTYDFLEKLKEKYARENMLLLSSSENACLFHQTQKKSVFQVPKKYKEIVAFGDFRNAAIAVFTYIPVSSEGKPIIEYLFKKNEATCRKNDGFIALCALKPIKSETYLVITFWSNINSANKWIQPIHQHSYPHDHFLYGLEDISQFSKKPYVVIYSVSND